LLESEPASDEAALVESGYLRAESELWDVADGALVAQDAGCATASDPEPIDEIVTDVDAGAGVDEELAAELAALTPDDILDSATAAEIDQVGGKDCAYEVAVVGLAYSRWSFDRQAEPESMTVLVTDGYLPEGLALWTLGDTSLEAIDGSGCIGPVVLIDLPDPCMVEYQTLEVAIEAYVALNDRLPDNIGVLEDEGLMRDVDHEYDVVYGEIVPGDGTTCEAPPVVARADVASVDECAADRTTLEVAVEAYTAAFGTFPTSIAALVQTEMIRAASDLHTLDQLGQVVPLDGPGCP
jgi:hypothetical protein